MKNNPNSFIMTAKELEELVIVKPASDGDSDSYQRDEKSAKVSDIAGHLVLNKDNFLLYPSILVIDRGELYELFDGQHRRAGAIRAGSSFKIEVIPQLKGASREEKEELGRDLFLLHNGTSTRLSRKASFDASRSPSKEFMSECMSDYGLSYNQAINLMEGLTGSVKFTKESSFTKKEMEIAKEILKTWCEDSRFIFVETQKSKKSKDGKTEIPPAEVAYSSKVTLKALGMLAKDAFNAGAPMEKIVSDTVAIRKANWARDAAHGLRGIGGTPGSASAIRLVNYITTHILRYTDLPSIIAEHKKKVKQLV